MQRRIDDFVDSAYNRQIMMLVMCGFSRREAERMTPTERNGFITLYNTIETESYEAAESKNKQPFEGMVSSAKIPM